MGTLGKTWKWSTESRLNASLVRSEMRLSESHKRAIGDSQRGRKHTEETKAKMSAARRDYFAQQGIPIHDNRKFHDNRKSVGAFSLYGKILRERDGDLCQLCLELIDFKIPARRSMARTVDHIVPLLWGGTDRLENLWLAHSSCNTRKAARYIGRLDGTTEPNRKELLERIL